MSPPPAASAGATFDAADNLIDQLDFSQYDHQTSFDGANRPTQAVDTCASCPGTPSVTTTPGYDPDGNVLSLTRQEGATQTAASTAAYNPLDWLSSQDDGQGTTSYGYDAAGRLRTQSLLGSTASGVVTSSVNAAGWVTAMTDTLTDTGQAPTSSTSQFTYTLDGLPLTTTLHAGSSAPVQEARGYDGDNHLLSVLTTAPAGVFQSGAAYSPQGWTTEYTQTDATLPAFHWRVDHDALGRLAGETSLATSESYHWTYDGNENLQTAAYTSVAGLSSTAYGYTYTAGLTPAGWLPNELVSTTLTTPNMQPITTAYSYDLSGNTTAITRSAAVTSLVYDASDRLTTVSSGPSRSPTLTVTVGYNARGLRASLAALTSGGPTYTERFLYRGGRVGQIVVTGTTSFTETFLYRPDGAPLELLYQPQGGATTRYWYVLNPQGSVMALIDGSGSIANLYAYDAWGKLLPAVSYETLAQPLRYAGYWDDAWYGGGAPLQPSGGPLDAGPVPWYWLTTRYYDPSLERFLQPDPSAQDGVRSYTYVHDAPLDLADPSGLSGSCGSSGSGEEEGAAPPCAGAAETVRGASGARPPEPTLPLVSEEDVAANSIGEPSSNSDALQGVSRTRSGQYRLPFPEMADESSGSGSIRYGELDEYGRPTFVEAIITGDMIGKGSEASDEIRPPGFQSGPEGHARGHLLADQLAGSGDEERNLVTLYQDMNNSQMKVAENAVRRAVESGQTVAYRVEAIYATSDPEEIPTAIRITAEGSGGFTRDVTLLNVRNLP